MMYVQNIIPAKNAVHWIVTTVLLALMAGCAAAPPAADRMEKTSQPSGPGYVPPQSVVTALELAGSNRRQLEAVLVYYHRQKQPLRLRAAEFLIENMVTHGTAEVGLVNEQGKPVFFNVLEYDDYEVARDELERLQDKHGRLQYKKLHLTKDIETITAGYLIENIDLAFEAWRNKPWARDISFTLFCDFILPYRGTSEPLSRWRQPMMFRYLDAGDGVEASEKVKVITGKIRKDVRKIVGFDRRYYLHPNTQSFEQMCRSRHGRCGDITNMMAYGMRANGFAAACDFTPAWADRDNNHAWLVVLDRNGQGSAALTNRAAKVYRRTFSIQPATLGVVAQGKGKVPAWLSGSNYMDVTDQYMETSDVTIELVHAPETPQHFVYICVFNGGQWIPIHWAEVEGNSATFTRMGRNIAYLAAYYTEQGLVPAASPFIVHKDGQVQLLDGTDSTAEKFAITVTREAVTDADTNAEIPRMIIEPGKNYTLLQWEDKWVPVAETTKGEDALVVELSGRSRLFWCIHEEGRRLERIFTVENGKQVMY